MKLPVAQALLPVFFLTTLHATTFYLTVAGIGGEPDYEQRFTSQALEIDKLVKAGGPDASVTTLSGAQATKSAVRSAAAKNEYLHFSTHGFFAPAELRSALRTIDHQIEGYITCARLGQAALKLDTNLQNLATKDR